MEFHLSTFLVLPGIALLIIRALRLGRRPNGYPSGPSTVPILGNIHQVNRWLFVSGILANLARCSQETPQAVPEVGGRVWAGLRSHPRDKELLDRRSAIYCDRQDMYVGQTLCSDELKVLTMVCTNPSRASQGY